MARMKPTAVSQPKPPDLITYTVTVEDEDQPVDGNASAWGTAEDKAYADEIKARLARGDVWAWCVVKVIASVDVNGQTVKGESNWLGGCCYADEKDYRASSGYFEEQCAEALDALKSELQTLRDAGPRAAEILGAL